MRSWLSRVIEIRFPQLWMPWALYVPLGVAVSALSLSLDPRPFREAVFLVVAGLLSWTFIEYLLHRFLLHWNVSKEPWRSLTSGFHLSHHEAVLTHDVDFIITRPAGSLPFAVFFYGVFSCVTFSFSASALIITGVSLGYLAYEGAHYAAHRFQPKNPIGRFLRRYHLQHHFGRPGRRFGVTSPLWDLVFGTYQSVGTNPDQPLDPGSVFRG